MKAKIIRIGNSQGVRIPKPALEQCRLKDRVEMEVRDESLVISPSRRPRRSSGDTILNSRTNLTSATTVRLD